MKLFHLSDSDKIATLSFGAKTKLSLLLALSRNPQVLILDEPTTGLDAVSKQQVFSELLKAVETGERTVLISSHGLTDIERFADHIGMIKNGKLLLEGRTDEIVDRFRLAEFFSDNGVQYQNRDGLIILKQNENRWHALLDQKSGIQDWLQSKGANEISLTRVTLEDLSSSHSPVLGGSMKRIILDHFWRWRLVLVAILHRLLFDPSFFGS